MLEVSRGGRPTKGVGWGAVESSKERQGRSRRRVRKIFINRLYIFKHEAYGFEIL